MVLPYQRQKYPQNQGVPNRYFLLAKTVLTTTHMLRHDMSIIQLSFMYNSTRNIV